MNSINDERGCSVCQPGKENYTTYTTKLTSTTIALKVVNFLPVVRLP